MSRKKLIRRSRSRIRMTSFLFDVLVLLIGAVL